MSVDIVAALVVVLVCAGAVLIVAGYVGLALAALLIPKSVRERCWRMARQYGWRSVFGDGQMSVEDRTVLWVGARRIIVAGAVVVFGVILQVIGWRLPTLVLGE